jgi:hypothetical protein
LVTILQGLMRVVSLGIEENNSRIRRPNEESGGISRELRCWNSVLSDRLETVCWSVEFFKGLVLLQSRI